MHEVVIVSALRSAIGSFQGQWSRLSAPELAAQVIRSMTNQTGIAMVDECLLGCVLSAGVGQAPARQALLKAGLSQHIPCTSINKVCGSGMKAVSMGWDSISAGVARLVLAGGMESMTNAPYLVHARGNWKMGHQKLLDHMFYDGLENAEDGRLMGCFAEQCAENFNFTRQQQDSYSITSVERARDASDQGLFDSEIVPINAIARDEQIDKCDTSKVHKLKPAFNHIGGTVTAANASSISDGAALLLLSEKNYAEEMNLPILARLVAHASYAQAPEEFTTAVQGAVKKCLQRAGWKTDEVGLFEINEAFAVVVLAAMQSLQLTHDQVNIRGGACAMGHPIGASGARIIVTLVHAMLQQGVEKGIASVCIGGGEAMAVALQVTKDIN